MKRMLEGKIVLITGTSSGVGREAALLFASEGAQLVTGDVNEAEGLKTMELVKAAGGSGIFVRTDVSREEEVKRLVESAVKAFGRIDCAFNNAGIDGNLESFLDITDEDWNKVLGINLKGHLHLMKHEIPEMLKRGKGAIVNTCSICGVNALPNNGVYCTSRFGGLGLTKVAALEFAGKGIRINAVGPAAINTPLFQKFTHGNPEIQENFRKMHPIGRIAEPREIAEVACWLLSDRSSFVVGHLLLADGGITLM
jgi:NAD(P)-dependent dehydrogenase (short-subunit alcohol dehydrogenase family)